MRTVPLEHSAELPKEHETWEGCDKATRGPHANCATGAVGGAPYDARNVRGVRQSEARAACGHTHWSLRWSFPRGHEPCEGCANIEFFWVAGTHADAPTAAFGGAPYGATNRVRGGPKMGVYERRERWW